MGDAKNLFWHNIEGRACATTTLRQDEGAGSDVSTLFFNCIGTTYTHTHTNTHTHTQIHTHENGLRCVRYSSPIGRFGLALATVESHTPLAESLDLLTFALCA